LKLSTFVFSTRNDKFSKVWTFVVCWNNICYRQPTDQCWNTDKCYNFSIFVSDFNRVCSTKDFSYNVWTTTPLWTFMLSHDTAALSHTLHCYRTLPELSYGNIANNAEINEKLSTYKWIHIEVGWLKYMNFDLVKLKWFGGVSWSKSNLSFAILIKPNFKLKLTVLSLRICEGVCLPYQSYKQRHQPKAEMLKAIPSQFYDKWVHFGIWWESSGHMSDTHQWVARIHFMLPLILPIINPCTGSRSLLPS